MNFFSVLDDSDNEEAPKVVPAKKGKDAAAPAAAPAKKDAAPVKKDAAPAKKDAAPKAPKADDSKAKKGKLFADYMHIELLSLLITILYRLQLTVRHPPTRRRIPKYHTLLLTLTELIRRPTRTTTEAAAPPERDTVREPQELPELLKPRVTRRALPDTNLIAEAAVAGTELEN